MLLNTLSNILHGSDFRTKYCEAASLLSQTDFSLREKYLKSWNPFSRNFVTMNKGFVNFDKIMVVISVA